jgi:Smg protein
MPPASVYQKNVIALRRLSGADFNKPAFQPPHRPPVICHPCSYLRYIESMFEVLVFVYENYWQGDACPEPHQLGRKLTAVGFEAEEIYAALIWLDGLNIAAHSTQICLPATQPHPPGEGSTDPLAPAAVQAQSTESLRVYSTSEQEHLGAESLGFVSFLEASGVLPPHMREIVIDRAMAAPGNPVGLDDLKIIVLMVYWSFGEEPDALVLDELCDDSQQRVAH